MKKIASLIMALALVLCLATVAFATEGATVLDDISWNVVDVDTTYEWTAPAAGNLDLSSNGWVNIAVSVDNEEAYGYFYDNWGVVSNLAEGDVVTITVTAIEGSEYTYDYLNGAFVALGSVYNPYSPEWTWDGLSYKTPVIAPNEGAFFYFNGIEGSTMVIESAEVMAEIDERYYLPSNGVLSYEFEVGGMGPRAGTSGTLIQIVNTGAEAQSFDIVFNYPLGTQKNPEVITEFNTVLEDTAINGGWNGFYYYSFTAPTEGALTFYINDADWAAKYWDVVEMTTYDSMSFVAGMGLDCVTKQLAEGEKIIIFTACNVEDPMPAVPVAFSFVGPEGTISNPIVVETSNGLTSAEVAAESEVHYLLNSRMDGMILTVKGADAYVIVNGTKVAAVDGVVTVDLTATGATIPVVIGNADDEAAEFEVSMEYAPTAINGVGDFTSNVGAASEVKYAVNSKLAGAILTVKGEGAYIDMNGTKIAAVDGVASVVLDGTGAVIPVSIGNSGTAAATYEASIAYAPTAINATGDYKVNVAAGAQVEYVVNSKLDGAVLTVKGEGAYAIVNGTKVEAKDGVVTAELKASAATISVVIGNAGTAAAEYQFSITLPSDIPNTGDMGVVMSVAALAMSAIGGVAMVAKKKEF